jgi:energy-coupling factor transport system permease protein
MIRDITIGQYYPADSVIHRLDPRVKLIGTFLFIISLFLFKSLFGYIAVVLLLAVVIRLSKVPIGFIVKGMKAIIVLLLFTTFFNLFFSPGGNTIFRLGFIKITDLGLSTAVFMIIRLTFLIVGSSLMTFTTTPNQLTDGLEKVMKPLNHIKVPVHEIAMMMSIALRFIPILLEETDKIMKAQMARGADFESGGVMKRAKSLIPLLVPLFVSAFRRANDLAMAMEARCYRGGDGRTKMKPLHYHSRDFAAYAVLLLYMGTCITIGILAGKGLI